MSRPRRRLLCVSVITAGGVWVLTHSCGGTNPKVDESFLLLHDGMTAFEVETILGRPADDEGWYTLGCIKTWDSSGYRIEIQFFQNPLTGHLEAVAGKLVADDGRWHKLKERPPHSKAAFQSGSAI